MGMGYPRRRTDNAVALFRIDIIALLCSMTVTLRRTGPTEGGTQLTVVLMQIVQIVTAFARINAKPLAHCPRR